MAPAPIKPMPDKIPKGSRIKSITAKEEEVLPAIDSKRLINLKHAERSGQTHQYRRAQPCRMAVFAAINAY
jgi:hypothetical protein